MRKMFICILILLPGLFLAQTDKKQDVWDPFQIFVGKWEGKGSGKSGNSHVIQEFCFILDGKYLHMRTKAIFKPQPENPKVEIHEDWGFISYDKMRGKFVFRQFHVEGFVNRYILDNISDDGRTFSFVSEQLENAPPNMKAKEVFKFLDNNTLEAKFNLAIGEKEFECYSTNILKRKL